MLQSVLRHAFCGPAPLLRELSIRPEQISQPPLIRLEPRERGSKASQWQTIFEVNCTEGYS